MFVRVEDWQPKLAADGKPTGYLSYVKQKTLDEVEDQLKSVLKSIYIDRWQCDAFDGAYWISINRTLVREGIFPRGEPIVLFRYGANEGYRLQVYSENDDGELTWVFNVKYLSDEESVWMIVRQVAKAFRGGL